LPVSKHYSYDWLSMEEYIACVNKTNHSIKYTEIGEKFDSRQLHRRMKISPTLVKRKVPESLVTTINVLLLKVLKTWLN
jgi:hypothetical protein